MAYNLASIYLLIALHQMSLFFKYFIHNNFCSSECTINLSRNLHWGFLNHQFQRNHVRTSSQLLLLMDGENFDILFLFYQPCSSTKENCRPRNVSTCNRYCLLCRHHTDRNVIISLKSSGNPIEEHFYKKMLNPEGFFAII